MPRIIHNTRPAFLLACLFLLSTAAGATNLLESTISPIVFSTAPAGLKFNWDDLGATYTAALSTSSSFVTTLSSGTLTDNTSTYFGLSPGDTHYFKVKFSTEPDTEYAYSTATVVNTPAALGLMGSTVESSINAWLIAPWDQNGSQNWVYYNVEASSRPLPNDYGGNRKSTGPHGNYWEFSGLFANTTYYVRVRAIDIAGTPTIFSNFSPGSTFAQELQDAQSTVYSSSITVTWSALPASPPEESCRGYALHVSTSQNFEGLLHSSVTSDSGLGALSITDISPNTTYYYKVGAVNWSQNPNFTDPTSLITLTDPPLPMQLLAVYESSATSGWPAYPQSPSSSSALGYLLEASSTNFIAGTIFRSSSTHDLVLSTLTVANLDANTTYYFRMGALNLSGTPNYGAGSSTVTLAQTVNINKVQTIPSDRSITVRWFPLVDSPQKDSCEGYRLEASTISSFTGAVIYSSATFDSNVSTLIVSDVWPNTTYYMRLGSFNLNLRLNYLYLDLVTTDTGDPLASLSIDGIYQSSISVSWSPISCDGYVLEASSTGFDGPGVVLSSGTTDTDVSSLFVINLDTNTVYFLRVGSIFSGAPGYTNTSPSSISTLAPDLSNQQIAGVLETKITVNWTPLPASPPQSASAKGYRLEASTSADFQTISFSSTTYDIGLGTLTVKSLTPDTSYYLRAGALNWNNSPNYVTTSVTSTLANVPVPEDFSGLAPTALIVNWSTNLNQTDTLYFVEISSGPLPNSYAGNASSNTYTDWAPFSGLIQNTTYYPRATAINRHGIPAGPVSFQPVATLADNPVFLPHTGIGISSVTLNWGPGMNPSGTFYVAKVSIYPSFSPAAISSKTLTLSATFQNLASNTTYYLEVSALNRVGVPTTPASLGEVLTYPAAPGNAVSTFTSVMLDAFTVNWAANGNSTMTVYEVEISTILEILTSTESFSFIHSSAETTPPALSAGFIGFRLGTIYYARVRAKGLSGLKSFFTDMGSVWTLSQSQSNVIYNIPNTVVLPTAYGDITVYVPVKAFGSSLYLNIETVSNFAAAPCPAATLTPLANPRGIMITVNPKLQPVKPLTITIPYKPSDLAGADGSCLVIARYDLTNNVWTPLASVSNLSDNSVTARTWHLCTFQLMLSHAPDTLNNVTIFPNPFGPSRGHGIVQITNLPPRTKVRIFTFLGELIYKTHSDSNGIATWHGKNRQGAKVASGVYLVLLEKENDAERKMLKLAVER